VLKKVSLSAMIFMYLFAGIAHFIRFDYYLTLIPPFVPQPWIIVAFNGFVQIILALFLAFRQSRKAACYCLIFFWGATLPIDAYMLITNGAGSAKPHWVLAASIPFHLSLMAWAYWQARPGKTASI
jgi:uncharacterized membrane protein